MIEFRVRFDTGARDGREACLVVHSAIPRLKAHKRSSADKAVAPQPLAADDALKQKRPVAFLNLAERRDRRQGVGDQLAVYWNQTVTLGQLQVFIETGTVQLAHLH